MADNGRRAGVHRFCLEFAETGICNKQVCTFWHKLPRHFRIIHVKRNDHYILGRLIKIALCHHFQNGTCPHGSNCRYLHSTNPNAGRGGARNNYSGPLTRQMFSFTNSNREREETENAGGGGGVAPRNNYNGPLTRQMFSFTNRNRQREETENAGGGGGVAPRNNYNGPLTRQMFSFTSRNRQHEETENACALPLTDAQNRNDEKKKKKNSLSVTAPEFVPISPSKASCSSSRNKNENKVTVNKVERKQCGICFETVLSKVEGEPRFGILPNCNHCYCLTCIRKWRQSRQFENQRCCPECRIKSDFVCPSSIWVENSEAKQKLIDKYKAALATKDCKYFGKGMGRCPFGNKCFYRHAFPDGSTCDVGPPRAQRRVSHNELNGSYNELISSTGEVFETVILWDLLDDDLEDDDPRLYGFTDNLVDFFSDSDSSWSGYDLFLD